jgi:hypothetical protein
MIAPARRSDAGALHSPLWQRSVHLRQDWLDHGLSTKPADRTTAEQSLTRVYARIGRARPRFVWVDSPFSAIPLVDHLPTLADLYRWIRDPLPRGRPPLASDLAAAVSALRGELSASVEHPDPELTPVLIDRKHRWPRLPPSRAFAEGMPLGVLLYQGFREALYRSLGTGFFLPLRAALGQGRALPVCWYGQQEASWVGYYDMLRRLDLASYGSAQLDDLADWADLVRSCGWWWPDEEVCVVVERPASLTTEPARETWHDEVQVRSVTYRDGRQQNLPG